MASDRSAGLNIGQGDVTEWDRVMSLAYNAVSPWRNKSPLTVSGSSGEAAITECVPAAENARSTTYW